MNVKANITTLTSREFNQNTSRAKQAAKKGPVFITDHGHPAHVLLTIDEYERLKGRAVTGWDALAAKEPIDINLDEYLPKREVEPFRPLFGEDEA